MPAWRFIANHGPVTIARARSSVRRALRCLKAPPVSQHDYDIISSISFWFIYIILIRYFDNTGHCGHETAAPWSIPAPPLYAAQGDRVAVCTPLTTGAACGEDGMDFAKGPGRV